MRGYDPTSYGDGFADVYDEWYADISDIDATVAALVPLANGLPLLELGIGTGRLALPLAAAGLDVSGVDTSAAMLDKLRAKPGGERIHATIGDMASGLPPGPFGIVFVAYNTFFSNMSADAQQDCFNAVATRLASGGRFVIEAFVPGDPPKSGSDIAVRSIAADRVVLSVSVHHPETQIAEGQYVEITEAGGVKLRPWSIRYATPEQLDTMALAAGLALESRSSDWTGGAFDTLSSHHVSIWRRP
jgi:SAM-dependent methyltransferase